MISEWSEDMKIRIACLQFVEALKDKGKSPGTIKEYQKDLKMFLEYLPEKGDCLVKVIKGSHLASYLVTLVNERKYKASSRNRQMNTLRSFFKFCKKAGIIKENPAEYLERLGEDRVERVFLSSKEVDVLIKAIDHPLIKLVILTLFFTGARISECLNLQVDDVDFERKLLFIRNGKGNKARQIPLHQELERVLKQYIDGWRVSSNSNKLFLTERSGKLSGVYVNSILKETANKLRWNKNITCHVLRHSFASALVQKNVHIVTVKELLGHVSLRTTSGYAHIQKESVEEAISKLAL
jgi:site-specific recombinase XerD